MRIYIDFEMCNELGVTYYGDPQNETIKTTPHDLMRMRKYRGGYDQRHMDFFEEVGEFALLLLKNTGLGWWVVQ